MILSQLEALTGELTLANLAIPVVSALGFLVIGGYLAVFVLPGLIDRYLLSHIPKDASMRREWVSLAIMFALLLGLIPATYYCRASPLMGAFLAGLVFCSSHSVHLMFESQFKRVMQWLLRIFFAASIGKSSAQLIYCVSEPMGKGSWILTFIYFRLQASRCRSITSGAVQYCYKG